MLRICISGLSNSGKTSLGYLISKDLNIMNITKHTVGSFKKDEKEIRKSVIQTAEKKYANAFDKEVAELAEKNDCVVTTWLSPWIVKNPTIRVWLDASFEERASRCAESKNIGIEKAKAFIKEKDELTIKGFRDVYGIDINDHSDFDITINTEKLSKEESASVISMLALGKEKSRFR